MKTFEQVKSNFRVCQINNNYYIQIKRLFGWSFDTREDKAEENYPNFPTVCFVFAVLSIVVLIISGSIAIFKTHEYNNTITISLFMFALSLFSGEMFFYKSKKVSICCNSLAYAEKTIDRLSKDILNAEIEKNEDVKYHYFYTEKQLRKEKLKKIK